ncbi:hypothetical protein DICPUDRAFT_146965 [Dictyostelium purpureum]|uniref:Uncharacterized protein n=1 Tax=Dictyostelium purpureum TaxID=5786 RepID=F0Z7B3_DICPU|nr:uncharacterized protein DICPUDRAFT_146965 [Dictyostelium purpureum]EGC40147.1 hypothetical protein DICPUDRAFT_146965 [Dictyostelium purpureum]|eukprot:XP_003283337.1 hypothetical protein DICPUDRAFT_146965 [Dictyostelium purpureum]
MRFIATLLVFLAVLFVVRSEDAIKLVRYCSPDKAALVDAALPTSDPSNCPAANGKTVEIGVGSCQTYTDICQPIVKGQAKVTALADSKFKVDLFNSGCETEGSTPISTQEVECSKCYQLTVNDMSLGYFSVECPAASSASEPASESTSSSSSTIVASAALALGSIAAALL